MSRRDRVSGFSRLSGRYVARPVRRAVITEAEHTPVPSVPSNQKITFKPHTLPSRTLQKPNNSDTTIQKSKVLQRAGLKKLPPFKVKKKVNKKPIFIASGATTLLFVLVIGGLVGFRYYKTTRHHQVASKAQPTNTEGGSVMGTQDNRDWMPNKPTLLFIDRMSLTTDIEAVGGTDKSLEPPDDLKNVGWFEGSSKPGEGGAVVLTGRVSSGGMPGAINRINMLGVGDNIQVRTKDGRVYNYKVYKTKAYDLDSFAMNEIMTSVIPSHEGLNLVTFTDKYDVRVQRFEQRLVVFAVKE